MQQLGDVLGIVSKIQVQLFAIDQKLNMLMNRIAPGARLPVAATISQPKPHEQHHKARPMYRAVCADCQKECSIPFKPSGDRPVYCQECFSHRKSGQVSKDFARTSKSHASMAVKTKSVETPKSTFKKKKMVVVKKASKKKTASKKK